MGQKAPDAARTDAQGRSVREPLRRDDANKTHLRRWPTVHSRTRRRERKAQRPSGGRIRERRPIVKPARPRAMRTTTCARVRVISSYETLCVVRSLVCVRTRTRDAPRRRRRVTIERSRRGASGGALAVGTPPPRARARFLVASFFFFSPFSPIAISRSREIAKSRSGRTAKRRKKKPPETARARAEGGCRRRGHPPKPPFASVRSSLDDADAARPGSSSERKRASERRRAFRTN